MSCACVLKAQHFADCHLTNREAGPVGMRSLLFLSLLLFVRVGYSTLADSLLGADLLFVYVHGFAELKDPVPFEAEMRRVLRDTKVPMDVRVHTFRYDTVNFDLSRVTYQWTRAKETGFGGRHGTPRGDCTSA